MSLLAGIGPASAGPGATAATRQTEIARAASMLEGLFLRQLLKAMRETVPESSLFGESLGQNIYTQMLDESIADEVSRADGVGLRDMLFAQLGGQLSAKRPRLLSATPTRATAMLRQIAALTPGQVQPPLAQQQALDGVTFDPPNRPESVKLSDPDGRLHWPIKGAKPTPSAEEPIATRPGAEIVAAGSGQVVAASSDALVIDHGRGLQTRYLGLGRALAQPGDLVLRGQTVGAAGPTSGIRFQVLRAGKPLDPGEISRLLTTGPDPQKGAQVR